MANEAEPERGLTRSGSRPAPPAHQSPGRRSETDDDPSLRVGRYLRGAVGRAYGLEIIREVPGEVGYRWTKCAILEGAREDGTEGLPICEAHATWWREIARSIDPPPTVTLTQNMRDGAPWCEIWLRRGPPAEPGSGRRE